MKTKIKYLLISNISIIIMSAIISFIFTMLISKNIVNPSLGTICTKIISALIFILSTLFLGRKIKSKGYFLGILAVLTYLFIVLCCSLTSIKFSTPDIIVRCICLFAGAIIGVNSVKN